MTKRFINSRWYPGIRLTLVLLVLAPTASVAFLTTADAASSWSNRQGAQSVARDTAQLEKISRARAELNAALLPTLVMSFASNSGADEAMLSKALQIDLPAMFDQSIPALRSDPTFASTPTLKAATAAFLASLGAVQAGTVDAHTESDLAARFSFDIDDLWLADFNQMQADMTRWRAPESLEVSAAALRETYIAYLSGEYNLEGALDVLAGHGSAIVVDPKGGWQTMTAKQEDIWFSGQYAQAVGQFAGHLGTLGQATWSAMQSDPKVQSLQATMAEAQQLALDGGTSPFTSDLTLAGVAETESLAFIHDLDALVQAASQDLRNEATAQSSAATHQFARQLLLLLVLVGASGAVVLFGGNLLVKPLKRLSAAAAMIHDGEFGFERLPDAGPRELASAAAMVNDMSFTLKAVEAKAVALATEDLSHPELRFPLPGRTGRALQAAVDRLTDRTHEREALRRQLKEAATHDRLTGLLNRGDVLRFLDEDVTRRRQSGETVAVLFVDLDGLKALNDDYGHEAGDAAIQVAADALMRATGACDVVGRLGGDEFLVVLCADHSTRAPRVAADIRAAVAVRALSAKDQLLSLQCSVGVAVAACDAETDPKDLVRRADEAMYEAKKAARAARDAQLAHGVHHVPHEGEEPGTQDLRDPRRESDAQPVPSTVA